MWWLQICHLQFTHNCSSPPSHDNYFNDGQLWIPRWNNVLQICRDKFKFRNYQVPHQDVLSEKFKNEFNEHWVVLQGISQAAGNTVVLKTSYLGPILLPIDVFQNIQTSREHFDVECDALSDCQKPGPTLLYYAK
ncbi:hypothetical protein AWENTII_010616 [Aspergillus wentii]